ncbi:retrovirus-related Pol polyprotein from transposon 17.6 [Trichonephila clavipes]|nr:retrovirus-related Pol polyprotein from transposon 17.6 [Trichonephila clavipes]
MSPELSDEQRNKAIRTTPKIFWAFHEDLTESTAAKTNVKHRIFTGDHAPINQRAYRVSPTERRIIHEEVQKCLMKVSSNPLKVLVITRCARKKKKTWYWARTRDKASHSPIPIPLGYRGHMCLCYLDDIIVFSETFEDHLIRLRLVLKCLQEAGLKLNSKKCLFAAQEVKILGHLVSSNGVRPDPDKIKAVRNFPTPKNIHDIRRFLAGHPSNPMCRK